MFFLQPVRHTKERRHLEEQPAGTAIDVCGLTAPVALFVFPVI